MACWAIAFALKLGPWSAKKMTPGLIFRVSVDTPVEAKNFSKSTDFVTFILILMRLCAYCVHKYRMKNLLFLLLFFFSSNILAQSLQFTRNTSLSVKDSNGEMANPWAGGINSAQFSNVDLNGDGRDDLFTFDRTNQLISVFLQKTNGAFFYAPEYIKYFPNLENWALFSDYDGDGLKDLFSSAPAGIRVFKNTSKGGVLSFVEVANPLFSEGFSGKINLYVASSDIPAIGDVDGDGDVDILAFEPGGHYIEWHQNMSRETGKALGLLFKKSEQNWGGFLHNDCRDILFSQAKTPGLASDAVDVASKTLHVGNSLALLDYEKDGLSDVLFGHVSCSNLVYLPNSGTLAQAKFGLANYDFPSKDPVKVASFAAAYPIDVDGDGKVEIVVSTNTYDNGGYLQDFQRSATLYSFQNGTWLRKTDAFLQAGMIDVGEGASPVWWDADGDGDYDLLIGNQGIRGNQGVRASIYFYENVGSATQPALIFRTNDFKQFSTQVQATQVQLQIATLPGKNQPSLLVNFQSFVGPGLWSWDVNASSFSKIELPVMLAGERPFLVDWDQDGLLDVLILDKMGKVRAYGFGNLTLQSSDWASLSALSTWIIQSIALGDLNADGHWEVVALDRDGLVHVGFLDAKKQKITWEDSIGNSMNRVGLKGSVTISDVNQDGRPDLMLGLVTGGVHVYENPTISPTTQQLESQLLQVFPNPAQEEVCLLANEPGTYAIRNLLGQILISGPLTRAEVTKIAIKSFAKGIYFIDYQSLLGKRTQIKWVVD
jgi:hypothetical protein